jgi:hypothetical protein
MRFAGDADDNLSARTAETTLIIACSLSLAEGLDMSPASAICSVQSLPSVWAPSVSWCAADKRKPTPIRPSAAAANGISTLLASSICGISVFVSNVVFVRNLFLDWYSVVHDGIWIGRSVGIRLFV